MFLDDTIDWSVKSTEKRSNESFALPAGDYLVFIDKTEMKQSKSGDCYYVNVKFIVESPEQYKNRVFFIMFITKHNTKPKVQEYGLESLRILSMNALGYQLERAQELQGKRVSVTLSVEPGEKRDDGTYFDPKYKIIRSRPASSAVVKQAPKEIPEFGQKYQAEPAFINDPVPF